MNGRSGQVGFSERFVLNIYEREHDIFRQGVAGSGLPAARYLSMTNWPDLSRPNN